MTPTSMETLFGHGRLGILVAEDDDNVYGVTGSHVTNQSTDGCIYIKDESGDFSLLGEIVKGDTTNINQDIHIFKIIKTWLPNCNNLCIDENKHKWTTIISTLNINTLCGKVVFTINRETDRSEEKLCYKYGEVATYDEHAQLSIDTEKFFLVARYQTNPFFEEGDSGGIVALFNDSRCIVNAGLVIGKFQNTTNATHRAYVLCLHIQHGLKALRNSHRMTLMENVRLNGNRSPSIRPGIKVWIKMKVCVTLPKESHIELCEHLIKLFDCFEDTVATRINSFWTENHSMTSLSKYVNNRTDVVPFESPTADHKCYLHAILACDFIFSESLDAAEKQLQIALKYVGQTYAPTRLLCKIFSYSTWLLLKQSKLKDMRELLDQALTRTEKMKDIDVRIHDSVGYFYFDYARYYIKLDKIMDALEMAHKSLSYFESFERSGKQSTEKQALVWVMIARLNLNCGEYFEKRHRQALDIYEAKLFTCKLYNNLSILPVVQKVSYYMVEADLQFRKNNYEYALEAANTSLKLSQDHNLREEFKKSVCKILCLEKLCAETSKVSTITTTEDDGKGN